MLIDLGINVRFNGSNPIIINLLNSRSFDHLRTVFNKYHKLTGYYIWEKLEYQISDSHRHILSNISKYFNLLINKLIFIDILIKTILINNIVQAIYDPQKYYVQLLWNSKAKSKFLEILLNLRLSRTMVCKN